MTARIVLLVSFACLAAAQPAVSHIRLDDLGHSSVRVTWDATTVPTNQRIQWGPTPSYGKTQYVYSTSAASPSSANQTLILAGQAAGSTIHLCPQSQNADGWSSCRGLDQTVTFAPLPSPHPVPATLPATFTINEPATTGCTKLTANSLETLQTQINTAAAGQAKTCYVINVTAGAVLRGQVLVPPAADVDTIASSSAATNTITVASAVNTYENGQRVRVAGDDWAGNSSLPAGLIEGTDYCVTGVSGKTLRLQLWPACNSAVSLNTDGAGPWYVTPFPPPTSNWIQIRTSSTHVPPDGVRPDPAWAGSMVTWGPATTGSQGSQYVTVRFRGTAHHYYFGPGIHFNTPNSNQTDTTDPQSYNGWAALLPNHSYIAFKRNWFSGGYPERVRFPFALAEGSYIDISDNYFQDISFWRPDKVNLAPTVANRSTVRWSSGSYFTNLGNCPSVASFTATEPTGSGTAYFTLNPVTCLPLATIPAGASVKMSAGTTATGADWPRNRAGRYAQALLGSCNFASNAWTGCANADDGNSNYSFSVDSTEGPQIITACGPGPLNVRNNYFESHSIIWHLDDSCSAKPSLFVSNVLFRRNIFATPDKYRAGAPGNNGAFYSNRNQWESKRGRFIWLDGNQFSGNFSTVNVGPSILINHNGSQCPGFCGPADLNQDFTATNNTIYNASGGMQLGGGNPNGYLVPTLSRRFTIRNNLIYNINGWTYAVHRAGAPGYCFELSFAGEDEILDHNTCYSVAGQQAEWLLAVDNFVEGLQITNNVFFFHEDQGYHGIGTDWGQGGTPNCASLAAKKMLDCFAPAYIWSHNLLIPGYANSQAMTGNSSASEITRAYAGLPNTFVRTESNVAGRIAAAGWSSPSGANFRFSAGSPYIAGAASAGNDGKDLGANIDQLEDAQGKIKSVGASSITSASASIAFHSPDSGTPCYVGYGTTPDPVTWNVTPPDASPSQERTIGISSLSGATAYSYQIWCSGAAPTATATFRTP